MNKEPGEDNVKVAIRCRPLLPESNEKAMAIQFDENNQSIIVGSREFTFDTIFRPEATQIQVYAQSAKHIVDSVLHGYNGTVFAYGQTGTGKTYTSAGILSHSFAHIFGFIAASARDTQFLVRASYYEIYNEEIRDLLNKNSKTLELKESAQSGVYVKDLSCFVINNVNELEKLLEKGNKQRAVASTNVNKDSSRSHTVFTIAIEQIKTAPSEGRGPGNLRVGKLNLVDLAGSERQSKTGTQGDRLKEAAKINLSLTSLSLVIAALTDPKATHIPYRNSKLTRLLSDSLGGNSKTLLIACIGPDKSNIEETISTLRFASTAKHIKNKARINEDAKDTLLRRFQEQILELRKQLEATEAENIENGQPEPEIDVEKKPANPELLEKLKCLEEKIMVGGENLLEKAELQEKLLIESEAELEARKKKEDELKIALEKKQAEMIQIEEFYGTLQEEVVGINKKLKKVFNYLCSAKSELSDIQSEYSKLREDLLDTIRATHKEIKLANLIISQFIPESCFEMIQESAKYNELVGEWQLKCIAYTGNNMHDKPFHHEQKENFVEDDFTAKAYLSYRK
ncbi:kinesin-like protein KIF3A [Tetranychus urticae]|uniref:Kinesin-like protein n=1 Tax=Tetranychus urticae TaxID=32264 RepID=T1KJK7_TETUR|nr:kinesin-like protein KIF3A [Tetranychus urticae]